MPANPKRRKTMGKKKSSYSSTLKDVQRMHRRIAKNNSMMGEMPTY